MKPRINLLAAITVLAFGALGLGCYAETGAYVVDEGAVAYDASPTLVAAEPGIWVVSGQPTAIYYADNSYWTYSGNNWYRSSYWNGGWASVNANVLPTVVVHHSTRYGSSHPTHHVPARPHVAAQVHHPRVYTGQTHVGHHVVHSNPGPSFRRSAGHSVHNARSHGHR